MPDNTHLIPEGIPGVDTLDDFTRAYIECMLWSSNDESTPSGGVPLDQNYSEEDIAPQSLAKIVEDCRKFQEENAELLERAEYNNAEYSDSAMAGYDFWLTRNGHGCGFWDRDFDDEDVGDLLTKACEKYDELYPYVGDDGKVYL